MTDTTAVLGYAWPLVVSPGERIRFHLSSATLQHAEATLLRVRCADPDPDGPGLRFTAPGAPVDGPVALRHQPLHPGSCAVVPDAPALRGPGSLSAGCLLWPTAPGGRPQAILSRWRDDLQQGWWLGLDAAGRLEFRVGAAGQVWRAVTPRPLLEREWAFVGGVLDLQAGLLRVFQHSLDPQAGRDTSAVAETAGPQAIVWPAETALVMAATTREPGPDPRTTAHLDGKIDRPRLAAAALAPDALRALCEAQDPPVTDPALVAAWDFSRDIPSDRVRDRAANRLDGRLRQLPMRAMTGANWDGRTQHWVAAPEQYGAIHFHSDDMADAGWDADLEMTIPPDWRSGFYALRLRAREGGEDPVESHVAFFVRAPLGQPRAALAVVASTATFLAYANSALRLDQVHAEAMLEGLIALSRDDVYLQQHRELGLSTYDTHSDGSGWCYSSAKRPILNMRPRGASFNYGNDTHILDWLEQIGQDHDVITDDDIHRHGAQLLAGYRCVISGSHPEYTSREMLDAFDHYQRGGGRHIYLGGNGFYWRIAYHPTEPHTMEIRRGMMGLRTWEGEAGENGLSFSGEPSGLWRANGRAPQRLVGVGFDAQVFTRSYPYRWREEARDPRIGWLTEGIDLDAPLGDFGLRGGGAAGIEVDRVEPTLGSPPALLWLATADRLDYGGVPTLEEFRTLHRGAMGDQNAAVRADIAFFPTARGGAVFSTGSIAWSCALSHAGYDNSVSRLTGNVLRRFLDPAPFDGFGET
ncbi:N,N-dimethylformamidase beta subunit family domain-containing protein [Roseomonas haemaphysalidis]|uniref:N,N-dimethylformamidase n=1 Tax=Roseomonas haemaphysalidis TaxID=2768162 RepID=A0ABS3KRT9_9PROT|nr:N,N-dimethylformamidase beta subunit family domain-containing protein [Roseomonas haemaphysalidis]MBO1080183.1 N,N-dimethylformamidase [Roseomonas haemaphysalidis]